MLVTLSKDAARIGRSNMLQVLSSVWQYTGI